MVDIVVNKKDETDEVVVEEVVDVKRVDEIFVMKRRKLRRKVKVSASKEISFESPSYKPILRFRKRS